jgi:hypothetical protein
MPAPTLRTGCRPWPCGRLSRPWTTTAAPSHPKAISRRRTCPPPARPAGGEGTPGRFPRSPRSGRRGRCPAVPRQPRHGYAADLHRGLPADESCRPSESTVHWAVVRCCPAHIHQVGAGSDRLRGFDHWFLAYTFPSCLPSPGRLAVPTRPVVVRAASALLGASRGGLPSASPACCDRPTVGPFIPPGHEALSWRADSSQNTMAVRRLRAAARILRPVLGHPVGDRPLIALNRAAGGALQAVAQAVA